jgi:hypothetical protein
MKECCLPGMISALDENNTHNPVSKFTELQLSFIWHASKQSLNSKVSGIELIKNDGAENT